MRRERIEMQERPLFHVVDFASAEGAALLAEVVRDYGVAVAAAHGLVTRAFAMQSPVAPGLAFVGAQARHDGGEGGEGAQEISTVGAGASLAAAAAGALAEACERLSQFERAGDIAATATVEEAGDAAAAGAVGLARQLCGGTEAGRRFDWVRGRDIDGAREVLVPADWVLRRRQASGLQLAGTALSTGVAAGADFADAACRALLELVERDAAALWWIGGRRARPVALEADAMGEAAMLLAAARAGHEGRRSWLLDVTSDLGIPTVAAISTAGNGFRMARGIAARAGLAEAARAAIVEMCQSELGLLVTEMKQEQRGEAALNAIDRQHLARARAIDAARCELLHPAGVPRGAGARAAQDRGEQLGWITARLAAAGIGASLVDLTRPETGLTVVAAVAPELQRLPSEVATKRLERAIAETGGGERATGGVALF